MDKAFLLGRISFEASFEDLQRIFGKGSHQLFVVFNIHTMNNTEVELIPGTYQVRELLVELDLKDGPGKVEIDKYHNEEVLRKKAVDDPMFGELLRLGDKYNMFFVVREFSMGSKST